MSNASLSLPVERSIGQSLQRGAKGRCPACGVGRIFTAYLKVADTCAHCGEDLHHHRADDMPPYVTMLITGHVMVASLMAAQAFWPDFPDWGHMIVWPLFVLLFSLWLLPIVKGALIAYQWALKMHGFDAAARKGLTDG